MSAVEVPGEGQLPVGPSLDWSARTVPEAFSYAGDWCWVAPLAPEHDADLFSSWRADPARFTYLPWGPFGEPAELSVLLDRLRESPDVVTFTIGRAGHGPEGMASLMRIDPANGSVEVGSILHASTLAGTPATTEAMYLLGRYVFDQLGYRRYEWKCDSLNAASRRAAQRLGFRYEGTWRNAVVYKGRSRDTAWFAMTDEDWPTVKRAMEEWLAAANVTWTSQRRALDEIRAALPGTPGARS
jgi:RimJ/RimL family protein N-acetyltransferase